MDEQIFDGKVYHLYAGERYYSRGRKRMHRVVWEYYNGAIPPGYQVHHKDGNPANNDISNLECISFARHIDKHRADIVARGKSEKQRVHLEGIREKAAEWHHSEAGREWHRQHAMGKKEVKAECVCKCCGKTFKSPYATTKFCSNACKSKWRRDNHLDDETRVCIICGKEFSVNHYSKAVCCGASCAARYRNLRRRREVGV